MTDTLIAELARQYVTLDADLCEATGARRGELAIAALAVRHDLQLACGMPCGCDDGTCEGLITTADPSPRSGDSGDRTT